MKKKKTKKNSDHPAHISNVIKKIPKEFLKPTLRQTIVKNEIEAMVVNGGKSKAAILRKAGFSKAVIGNPKKVFDSPIIRDTVDAVINKLEEERQGIINDLKEKRPKANYRDLIDGLDKVTKNIELLSGRPTSRESFKLTEEEQDELDELIKKNS